jgi:putative endopeptidase
MSLRCLSVSAVFAQHLRPCIALGLALLSAPLAAQPLGQALDARHRDATTAACADFYQHANGGWLTATAVPAGLGSFGYTDEVRALIAQQQRGLLEGFASAPADPLEASIARLYALGMDSAGIEAAGLAPLSERLQQLESLAKPKDLLPLIAQWHRAGLPVLFQFGAGPDLEQPPQRIAYARQGGLGLPDRDYYLREDPAAASLREAYRAYVERLLTLAGRTEAAAEAARVLALETELARASQSLEQLRDPRNSYRPTALRELERSYPNLRWRDYLKQQDLRGIERVSLAHLSFFSAANSLMASAPLSDWQAYLRFHLLHAIAPFLGEAFTSAHAELFAKSLGSGAATDRESQVLGFLQRSLGEALGQRYARAQVEPARREAALALAEGLRAQLRGEVEAAEWLSTEGRTALLEDIDSLQFALGGPAATEWEGFELKATSYAEAALALSARRQTLELGRIGKPEAAWPVAPTALSPGYAAALHTIYLPAGMLQAPLLVPGGDAALNHAATAVPIARAISAALDPAAGPRNGRLSQADREAWVERGRSLLPQFSSFVALGSIKVDGAATWNSNMLDLAGLRLAAAHFLAQPGAAEAPVDGLSPIQRFFHGYARSLRRNYQDEALRLQLASDTRAPARFRVNGPLPHLPAFAEAFACTPEAPLSLPEAARAATW